MKKIGDSNTQMHCLYIWIMGISLVLVKNRTQQIYLIETKKDREHHFLHLLNRILLLSLVLNPKKMMLAEVR